jgi:hypothetical protein
MIFGIVWICVWVAVEKPDPGFGWWPFDMMEDGTDTKPAPVVQTAAARATRRGGTTSAAREAHGARTAAPMPEQQTDSPTGTEMAGSGAAAPVSWRARAVAAQGGTAGGGGTPRRGGPVRVGRRPAVTPLPGRPRR